MLRLLSDALSAEVIFMHQGITCAVYCVLCDQNLCVHVDSFLHYYDHTYETNDYRHVCANVCTHLGMINRTLI